MALGMDFRSAPNYHAAASGDIPGTSSGNRSLTISAQIRIMLRAALLTGFLASAGAAFAQEAATGGGDFFMRPTEPAPGVDLNLDDETFWSLIGTEPAVDPAPMITGSIGPRMAGPRVDDPVGPPLAGPFREDIAAAPRPFPVNRESADFVFASSEALSASWSFNRRSSSSFDFVSAASFVSKASASFCFEA